MPSERILNLYRETDNASILNPPGEPTPRLGDAIADVLEEYREVDDAE